MRISVLLIVVLFTSIQGSAQTTAIPDPAFELKLINLGLDSGPVDGIVLTANIDTVTNLSLGFSGISDLTGIQDFIALEDLHCMMNNLTTLQLSQNTNLTTVYCVSNQLSFIDVSQCPNLWSLSCSDNQLTDIDISANINLVHFSCDQNLLDSINVTNNPELQSLWCYNNQITNLEITQNPELTHIGCARNLLTGLDISQNDLLEHLNFSENQISDIDLQNLPNLQTLYCGDNQLTSLDVKQNPGLQFLFCNNNQLPKLNVSENPILLQLKCFNNLLSCLNLKNTNSNNLGVQAYNNSNLNCVMVDDPVFSSTYWTNDFDSGTSFSTSCPDLCVVGITTSKNIELSIYPNPAANWLKIEGISDLSDFSIEIYNLNGQILIESRSDLILIENLSPGVYTICIKIQDEVIGIEKLSITY